jgi:hypothetical protein
MKPTFFTLFLLVLLAACNTKTNNGQDSHNEHDSANQALYDEVMKVHDEVMPKMNDIYKLKEELKKDIADAPGMVENKRKEIESAILQLDAASEAMMDWMRNFNPLPDSLGEERAREYLEEQKIKVDKVKEEMLRAIDGAKGLNE